MGIGLRESTSILVALGKLHPIVETKRYMSIHTTFLQVAGTVQIETQFTDLAIVR